MLYRSILKILVYICVVRSLLKRFCNDQISKKHGNNTLFLYAWTALSMFVFGHLAEPHYKQTASPRFCGGKEGFRRGCFSSSLV